MYSLHYLDLVLASSFVLLLAFLSRALRIDVEKPLLIASVRTVVQLLLIGLVLKLLFSHVHWVWVALMSMIMLAVAAYEIGSRQKYKLKGSIAYWLGGGSMLISSFSVTLITLWVIIQPEPWYSPQYAIPLLGMLLGNTMNGISLAQNHLLLALVNQRKIIESRLAMGETAPMVTEEIRREAMHVGMIPIINGMAAAGIVTLPGMMTGQILAGASPIEAVKYQILIMFLIAAGTGFGTIVSVLWTAKHFFDERHRLRLDRLRSS